MATIIPISDLRKLADPNVRGDAAHALLDAAASDAATLSGPVADTRGRGLRDLRISVTDRCNFRCVYCMPKEVFDADFKFLPHAELLTFEEIARVAAIFVERGVQKIRLTGGEPLLRRNIERLVEMLAKLGELDLTLTTNGALLAKKARSLVDAGLSRVTVSLDSLDDTTFRAMNDVDFPWRRSSRASMPRPPRARSDQDQHGRKRGTNDSSIVPMARRFKGTGHIVRFIEYMDVGATNGWRMDDVVPAAEVVRAIDAELPLVNADPNYAGEVSQRWKYRDGSGEIGVIASVTQAFCRDCTRARLSTDGKLYTCLFATTGYDLRALLRGGFDDAQIGNAIATVWKRRADRYSEIRGANTLLLPKVEMSYIGG